jgi:hypothetical protein
MQSSAPRQWNFFVADGTFYGLMNLSMGRVVGTIDDARFRSWNFVRFNSIDARRRLAGLAGTAD